MLRSSAGRYSRWSSLPRSFPLPSSPKLALVLALAGFRGMRRHMAPHSLQKRKVGILGQNQTLQPRPASVRYRGRAPSMKLVTALLIATTIVANANYFADLFESIAFFLVALFVKQRQLVTRDFLQVCRPNAV